MNRCFVCWDTEDDICECGACIMCCDCGLGKERWVTLRVVDPAKVAIGYMEQRDKMRGLATELAHALDYELVRGLDLCDATLSVLQKAKDQGLI